MRLLPGASEGSSNSLFRHPVAVSNTSGQQLGKPKENTTKYVAMKLTNFNDFSSYFSYINCFISIFNYVYYDKMYEKTKLIVFI